MTLFKKKKAKRDLIYKQMLVADTQLTVAHKQLKVAYLQEKVRASVLCLLTEDMKKVKKEKKKKSKRKK